MGPLSSFKVRSVDNRRFLAKARLLEPIVVMGKHDRNRAGFAGRAVICTPDSGLV